MENLRWSRLVAAVVCILALFAFAPQVAQAEEGSVPVVAAGEPAAMAQPAPVTAAADLSWLGEAAGQAEPPAGALEGALFLGEVPTHSCPFPCASVNCANYCAMQGGAGRCINGCCNCL